MPTKCSEMQFQKYTGCMIKCDEHGMDAATMPYGMTFWVSTNHARGQAKNIIEKAKQKKAMSAAKAKAKRKANKKKQK